MSRNRHISVASLVAILGGGAFLTTPASASGEHDCRESVMAYCEWVNTYSCGGRGAVCTYTTEPCQVTDARCLEADN